MNCVNDLIQLLEPKRHAKEIGTHINGARIQIYESTPLQFNVTPADCRYPTVKGEQRSPGKLTIAVAPEDGESIDYTQAKAFTMDEPLNNLILAFPSSPYIRQFVECLINNSQ